MSIFFCFHFHDPLFLSYQLYYVVTDFIKIPHEADDAVVGDAYRRTARIISPDIARTYTMERAKRHTLAKEDPDEALIESREEVAAGTCQPLLNQLLAN